MTEFWRIQIPKGWTQAPEQSQRITAEAQKTPSAAGVPAAVQARAWQGPEAALVVLWQRTVAPAKPAAIRSYLDRMRQTPTLASLNPGDAQLVSWNESILDGMSQTRMVWQHLRNHTETSTQALALQNAAGHVFVVQADCVRSVPQSEAATAKAATTAAADPSTIAQVCQRALASLAISMAPEDRQPLAALPPSTDSAAAANLADSGATHKATQTATPKGTENAAQDALPSSPTIRTPGLDGRGILVMESTRPAPQGSQRWLYVLGGALLLLAFYLTTRTRVSSPVDEDSHAATPHSNGAGDRRGHGGTATDSRHGDTNAAQRDQAGARSQDQEPT